MDDKPKKCVTEGCPYFGNEGNAGRCNHCVAGWKKEEPSAIANEQKRQRENNEPKEEFFGGDYDDDEEVSDLDEPENKRTKLNPFEYPPLTEEQKITIEQYKNFTAEERANLTYPQLLFLSGRNQDSHFSGSEIRKDLETKNKIAQICRCGSTQFLGVCSRACDNNYYKLPSGEEGEGYFPTFSGISAIGGDGPMFDLCILCGRVYGFDPLEMQENINRALSEKYGEYD